MHPTGLNLGDFQHLNTRNTQSIQRATEAADAKRYRCRATVLRPDWSVLPPGEPVAMDIEFQNAASPRWAKQIHRVGRVTIVNTKGQPILDVYAAYPKEDGVSKRYPPPQFGVCWKDCLYENGAVKASTVERWVKQIISNRRVLLWSAHHDSTAFRIETDVFKTSTIIDVQLMYSRPGNLLALHKGSTQFLEREIQDTEHSPLEDAQATMDLWLLKSKYTRPIADKEEDISDKTSSSGTDENGSTDWYPGRGRRVEESGFSLMDYVVKR